MLDHNEDCAFFPALQDYLACSSDLQEVLQQDPNVQEAEKELEEVTLLLRQSLANSSSAKPRKSVPITEVGCSVLQNVTRFSCSCVRGNDDDQAPGRPVCRQTRPKGKSFFLGL